MEFLKGSTDPVGDCGNFAAGIDVHGADQFPHDSKKRTWYSRVECYGNTAEHAEELRDKVLGLLSSSQPIYDEAKERELFGIRYPLCEPYWSEDAQGFHSGNWNNLWAGWKACAQSRAKAWEVSP